MKNIWKVIKVDNQWLIYNTTNGMMLGKFSGKGSKKEAMEQCRLYNLMELKNEKIRNMKK